MTTRDYQKKNGFAIFLSYFKPHRKLFILDMICATLVSFVNLIYPILSRRALHDLLPQKAYAAFFVLIGIMVGIYAVRACLQYIVQ